MYNNHYRVRQVLQGQNIVNIRVYNRYNRVNNTNTNQNKKPKIEPEPEQQHHTHPVHFGERVHTFDTGVIHGGIDEFSRFVVADIHEVFHVDIREAFLQAARPERFTRETNNIEVQGSTPDFVAFDYIDDEVILDLTGDREAEFLEVPQLVHANGLVERQDNDDAPILNLRDFVQPNCDEYDYKFSRLIVIPIEFRFRVSLIFIFQPPK